MRSTGARLKRIDDKLIAQLSLKHLIGGGLNCFGYSLVQRAESRVNTGGRLLYLNCCGDQRRVGFQAGNRKVLDRAGGLNPIVDISRQFALAERVSLNPWSGRR